MSEFKAYFYPKSFLGAAIIQSIDGLSDEERKAKYDTKRCSCGLPYEGQVGWYVPSFCSYIDKWYHCPNCIAKGREDYIHKNRRLKEIPLEVVAIQEQMRRHKSQWRSKTWCKLRTRIKELEAEKDECFVGSGFNPRANT